MCRDEDHAAFESRVSACFYYIIFWAGVILKYQGHIWDLCTLFVTTYRSVLWDTPPNQRCCVFAYQKWIGIRHVLHLRPH